jgi:hypothetical protein
MSEQKQPLQPPNPETVDAAMTAAYVANRLTRGEDALYLARRRAAQGDLEAAAGANDLLQGADMLSASEDIDSLTTVVHSINEEDLDDAMEIGAISGELAVLSDVLASLEMETISEFLLDRSQRLRELSVDNIMRYGALRALAHALDETGDKVAELGTAEMAEGEARLNLADAVVANSEAMAIAGEEMIAEGLATLAAAQGALDAGAELDS